MNTAGHQIPFQIAGSHYYYLACHRGCTTEHELRIQAGGGRGCLLTTTTICHCVLHKTARKMEIRFIILMVVAFTVKPVVSVLTSLLFCPMKIWLATTSSSLSEREAIGNIPYYLHIVYSLLFVILNSAFSYTSLVLL